MAPVRSVKPPPTPRPSCRHSNHYSNRCLNRYPDRHLHRHERRTPTGLKNFWIAYPLTRNDEDEDVAEQSRQFWAEYSLTRNDDDEDFEEQRRRFSIRAEQVSLLCPPRLSPQCTTLQMQRGLSMAQRARTAYKRFAPAVSTTARVAGGGIVKVASGTKTHGVSAARFCRTHWIASSILAIPLTISLIRANYLAALRRDSVPSPPLTKYHEFPTWLHTDPIQVLGYPAAVSPMFVSKELNLTQRFEEFKKIWWPDHWRRHNFAGLAEATTAYIRGLDAKFALDEWAENPWCSSDTEKLQNRHRNKPEFTYNDGLPSFKTPCRCTFPAYIAKTVRLTLIPYFWQSTAPQTEEALRSYCPCTRGDADASWSTFNNSNQPPYLESYDMVLEWTSFDHRVMKYKIKGRVQSWLYWPFPETWLLQVLSMAKTDTDLCVGGIESACKNVSKWAHKGDYIIWERLCESDQDKEEYQQDLQPPSGPGGLFTN